jgi:molybdopterin converting factor small subunit
MRIEVRLFSTLTQYLPPGATGKSAVLEVAEGSTVADLIRQLGIAPEMAHLTLVNGIHQRDKNVPLRDADVVAIFPPVAGG